jgi:hypothetical protein
MAADMYRPSRSGTTRCPRARRPAPPQRVLEIMQKQHAPAEDQRYMFYPETPEAIAAAIASAERISTRL